LNEAKEYVLPSTPLNLKSGAEAPMLRVLFVSSAKEKSPELNRTRVNSSFKNCAFFIRKILEKIKK
jgi:hypothetical protein